MHVIVKHLAVPESKAIRPICACLSALARDLGQEAYPYFQTSILPALLKLLDSKAGLALLARNHPIVPRMSCLLWALDGHELHRNARNKTSGLCWLPRWGVFPLSPCHVLT